LLRLIDALGAIAGLIINALLLVVAVTALIRGW